MIKTASKITNNTIFLQLKRIVLLKFNKLNAIISIGNSLQEIFKRFLKKYKLAIVNTFLIVLAFIIKHLILFFYFYYNNIFN